MKKHIIINGADKQQGIEVSGIVTWWKELKTTKGEETWKFYMARATGRPYGFTMASEEAANEAFFAICEAKGMEFEKPKQEEQKSEEWKNQNTVALDLQRRQCRDRGGTTGNFRIPFFDTFG